MNSPVVRPKFVTSDPPKLSESTRRSLADPFALGNALVEWQPPAQPLEPAEIRAAVADLQRTLAPAPAAHVRWCINKLFALPSRSGSPEAAAYAADNFLDVAEHYPADLWTWATTEILRSSKFRPAPAGLVALVEPKFAERKRMHDRARSMLEPPKPALPPPPFQPDIPNRLGRLEHMRSTYARLGRSTDVARIDRLIAIEQGEVTEPIDVVERPPAKPQAQSQVGAIMARRLAELAEANRAAARDSKS